MSASIIVDNVKEAIDNFQEKDAERSLDYQRAMDKYAKLESKGLVRKKGNSLLPIEERYKLTLEYQKGDNTMRVQSYYDQ